MHRIARLVVSTVPLATLLLASSCGEDAPTSDYVARDGRLHERGGREVLLRGVNARIEGIFDVTFDDGRLALEEIPPFTEDD